MRDVETSPSLTRYHTLLEPIKENDGAHCLIGGQGEFGLAAFRSSLYRAYIQSIVPYIGTRRDFE